MKKEFSNVSDEAVKKATGKSWDGWLEFIDQQGGSEMNHKAIVALLRKEGDLSSGWWQQTITVGYEQANGRRSTGETCDAGFQIGVQKVIAMDQGELWKLLTSDEGLSIWLGETKGVALEPGAAYETNNKTHGEIRTIKEGHRLRLLWQPEKRKRPTTLQLTLSCPRNGPNKTTLRFHHEKLDSQKERAHMRDHWRAVLNQISVLASSQVTR